MVFGDVFAFSAPAKQQGEGGSRSRDIRHALNEAKQKQQIFGASLSNILNLEKESQRIGDSAAVIKMIQEERYRVEALVAQNQKQLKQLETQAAQIPVDKPAFMAPQQIQA